MAENLLSEISPPPKSKAAKLAELLPAIEGALAVGHSHAEIHDYIKNKLGLAITYGYYELTLHRVRKRRNALSTATAPRPSIALRPVQAASPVEAAGSPVSGQAPQKFVYDLHAPIDDFFT